MKKMLLIAGLLGLSGLVLAQKTIVPTLDEEGRRGEMARLAKEKAQAKFDAADEDKDGKLSRDEVTKAFTYMAENFDKLDADKDGFLSWEEYVGHNRWPR
ncbi:exported protein of unknown function [Denitratisoma oestradiolicum]|uniref:EF-hand domain-containing protein n=2 Tax=Denitratisoma oestradiolicum TaxID=311182 RepID=A0A6S6XU08_9PROT|nr:exported protein of unknown function [Denitratisoma oestradiolicum]